MKIALIILQSILIIEYQGSYIVCDVLDANIDCERTDVAWRFVEQ